MSTPRKFAVVLQQFGGPDSLEAVEPFLFNLFSDPDIIELPFGPRFQRWLAGVISRRRAPGVALKYGEIGGKSPIVAMTELQRTGLESWLAARHPDEHIKVYKAMRYWKPFASETIKQLQRDAVTDVIHLPLYAQYSKTNAGSSYNEWDRQLKATGARFNERRIRQYHLDEVYLRAMNTRIDEALSRFSRIEGVYLLFSAHGTPVDMLYNGDPYARQIWETMEAIMNRRSDDLAHGLSFQSKVGPAQWLTPSTTEEITALGSRGIKKLLVVPIAFVSDHIETLHELDVEERHTAEKSGITEYIVMEGLNDNALFIEALGKIVEGELRILQTAV